MDTIKSILVTGVATLENHAANRGEKLLGNASSVKRRPDGRVYVSGQMQRHVLFSALDRINESDPNRGETYVSNGDGISTNIATDLRSDLGGFLDTNLGDYSGRRTAPLSVTPAVALRESQVGQDLLVRLKMSGKDAEKKQALTTNEYSQQDEMVMNFHLDIGAVGATKKFTYEGESHVATHYERHVDDTEHRRRIRLFLEATRSMTDYANQARNAVSGEPHRVLIVLDPGMSRKAVQYFTTDSESQQRNILKELDARGAKYFLGNDATSDGDTVYEAYSKALDSLSNAAVYRPEFS
ncbi:CRISPR-associated protein Cst2 [Lewinella marina]|uniref:Type I-PGING CRISPR-associated protein Cas7/Csp1 n=1 Tax=Neolewinella marina TaxID=438751 RepID=A0A2G0CK66_9BACT|nr:type I-PGING CRISPR-associated protein Cas7/Csp1 [Neolewinella marina]NJB84456.1 CRISPR-associated protein Cst2 [Neolewinella marina]PHL00352.1 type I-PGING CRISPR-associated protein Cas7/Csp1 [Neolewinella marina]